MKQIPNIFLIITVLIAVVLAWQMAKEYLKNQAVQGCMEVSSYTFTNPKDGVTTVEPIEKSFQKCLELKGY